MLNTHKILDFLFEFLILEKIAFDRKVWLIGFSAHKTVNSIQCTV